ncbi:hypothetical protein AAG747_18045 [Rapidithrix thailandica]|uniref:Uncharacterized protein n=1 Tax=Rapidithrix thailandica TaxID=413964 RepID=A0AAW9S8K6_9BACT
MKTFSKFFLGAFIMGAGFFGVSVEKDSSKEGMTSLTLQNVKALQASAFGAECDASNQNKCVINGVGEGTGRLISN